MTHASILLKTLFFFLLLLLLFLLLSAVTTVMFMSATVRRMFSLPWLLGLWLGVRLQQVGLLVVLVERPDCPSL